MTNMYNPGYLSQEQDDLLMAALNSNAQNQQNGLANGNSNFGNVDFTTASLDPSMLTTAAPDNIFAEIDGLNSFNDQQFLDFFDQSGMPADYDANQEQDDDNSAEHEDADDNYDGGEKRKSLADGSIDETSAKRREGEEKQAKKPGRKPLTSEPTTKRKAQNRAAQRAFRERKEKHLRDLEDKVAELEKTSESASHENGLLKAQVEKLQMELREYRKRLSIQNSLGRSPPTSVLGSFSGTNTGNPFNYNYGRQQPDTQYGPLFGSWSMQTSPQSTTTNHRGSTVESRHGSTDATSPVSAQVATPLTDAIRSQSGSVSNGSPSMPNAIDPIINRMGENGNYNIFMSPTSENVPAPQRQDSQSSASRLFQFNTSSNSSASPSASSSSQYGGNSSCGTSPEPTTGANTGSGSSEKPCLDTINESGKDFCAELNKACGTKENPQPLVQAKPLNAANLNPITGDMNNAPFVFTGGNADLFSASWPDLGDNQQPGIVGDGAFTGGFMNDTSNFWDMTWNDLTGSQRTGLTPAKQKDNPFDLVNSLDDIKEEVVPADPQMLSCNKIWSKIQSRQDFQDGVLDIDNLCSELRKKARCSESGVVVDKSDVDAALLRLPSGSKPATPTT